MKFREFLELNHRLCLEDPLQDEFRLKHILIDIILIFLFFTLTIKSSHKKKVFDMSSKNKVLLKIIRHLGASAGCIYIVIAYFIERCTFVRFILTRPRFLTENFVMYFTLYYVSISIWENLGKNPSNKFFNIWFNSLLIGTSLVTFGFWFLVMPYSWKYHGISPKPHDLLGHFFNLLWVIGELKFFSNHNIGMSSLFLVLFLISCYTCLIWFYQTIELICWVPYGPILTNTFYRLASIGGITGLYFVIEHFVFKKKNKFYKFLFPPPLVTCLIEIFYSFLDFFKIFYKPHSFVKNHSLVINNRYE